ncbi:uncharacterized protein LOC129582481 [Paramacrobiotus metropolitanus]|uniref:uncharacterized protein LOC129582481 n=1 Tax=Paramacrobiotus metropolitanus TaxID=2943436 RepID=UPI0024456F36|nr:uncharacterized protein LOC129582481 [Paramacrobiotus metropolitanus]
MTSLSPLLVKIEAIIEEVNATTVSSVISQTLMGKSNETIFTNATNGTAILLPPLRYIFGMPQILDVVFATVSLLLNGLTCLLILTNYSLLHNAFYLYVLNLSLCIVTSFVVNTPLYLVQSGYNRFWLGEHVCAFYLYGVYIIGPWAIFCHVLITANRFWAIVFPVEYRDFHTPRLAVILCGAAFLMTHVTMLPVVVLREVYGPALQYYRYQCTLSTPSSRMIMTAIAVCATIICVLEVLIVASYPVILYKYRKQRRLNPAVTHVSHSTQKSSGHTMRSYLAHANRSENNRDRPLSSGPFLTVTLFTVSYTFLMIPAAFYLSMGSIFRFFSERTFIILYILTVLQSIVDPIIFLTTLQGLRKALVRMVQRADSDEMYTDPDLVAEADDTPTVAPGEHEESETPEPGGHMSAWSPLENTYTGADGTVHRYCENNDETACNNHCKGMHRNGRGMCMGTPVKCLCQDNRKR